MTKPAGRTRKEAPSRGASRPAIREVRRLGGSVMFVGPRQSAEIHWLRDGGVELILWAPSREGVTPAWVERIRFGVEKSEVAMRLAREYALS